MDTTFTNMLFIWMFGFSRKKNMCVLRKQGINGIKEEQGGEGKHIEGGMENGVETKDGKDGEDGKEREEMDGACKEI